MASKLGTLTLDLVCRVGNFTQAMREASSSASREMGRIESSTSSAQSMLKNLAATAAATFTVSQIVNYADSYTGMVNKIKLVTENQSQLSIAMSDTHRIAQSTASEWGGVVDVYTKFQKISDRLGLSQAEVARVTETVTKAVGMSGASAEEAQRALIQFSQGLSLGVLRGQDLNSVMQQTPALTDAIAKGMGVTSDKLKQMGADNILTTESIVEALKKVAASVDADFAETATLVSASFDLIKNEAIKMIGEFDAATGASSTFVNGMTKLSENMDVAVGGLTVATAYMVGSYIPAIALGTKTLVVDTIAKVSSMAATRAKALADYEVAKSNLAATAAMARAMGATNAQTAAMMANARAAYQQAAANKAAALSGASLSNALLGPVGLGIAVASVAAGYLLLRDNTEKSSVALLENSEYAKQATEELLKLEGAQKRGAEIELDKIIAKQTKEVAELTSQFNAQIIAIQNSNKGNEQVIEISNKVRTGVMKKADAFRELNKLKTVTPEQIKKLEDLLKKLNTTNKTLKESELKAKSLATGINQIPIAAKGATTEIGKLDEKLKDFNKTIADRKYAAEYQIELITKFNKTPEQAAEMLKARLEANKAGLPAPTPEMLQSGLKALDYETKLKDIVEARTKALKDENKEKEKQYQYSKKELELLRKAYSDVSKSGLGAYAESKGIPANMIAGLYMQESKAGTALKSHTGALGPWQTTTAYRDQYNIPLSKNNDFLFVGKIVVDAISKELEKSGSLRQAILSHNAGPTGSKQFLDTGKVGGSPERNKEVAGYLPKIDKWASWGGGKKGDLLNSNNSGEAFEEYLEAYKKLQQDKAQFSQQFSSEDVIRNQKRIDDIAEAERLGLQHLIPRIEERYANETRLSKLQLDQQLNSWNWTEDEKLKKEAELNKAHIALSSELNDIQKQLAKESVDEQLAYDLQQFRKAQKWKEFEAINNFKAIQDQIQGLGSNTDDIFAKATMTPSEYESWSLKNNRDSAKLDLRNNLTSVEQNIMQSDAFDSEGDRYQALIDAHKEYRDALAAIDVDYGEQVKALEQDRFNSTIDAYSSLLSQSESLFSSLTTMAADAYGEQSSAFKAMYLMQQMAAIGQATINAYLAYSNVLAQAPYPTNMALAPIALGLGMANVGMIAGQTIAGMAHDGIDNIPKEGTWLLDRGERVVDRRTNADLKNYLAESQSRQQSSQVNVNPNIVIVDKRDSAHEYMMSKDGEKIFLYHARRNGMLK